MKSQHISRSYIREIWLEWLPWLWLTVRARQLHVCLVSELIYFLLREGENKSTIPNMAWYCEQSKNKFSNDPIC